MEKVQNVGNKSAFTPIIICVELWIIFINLTRNFKKHPYALITMLFNLQNSHLFKRKFKF